MCHALTLQGREHGDESHGIDGLARANGIRLAYAEAMAEIGVNVTIVEIHKAAAERPVIAIGADISRENETERMIASSVAQLGDLVICFVNAGKAVHDTAIMDYDKTVGLEYCGQPAGTTRNVAVIGRLLPRCCHKEGTRLRAVLTDEGS